MKHKISVVLIIVAVILLIHHIIKHKDDQHLSLVEKIFQIEDTKKINSHEFFIFNCILLGIAFY